MRREVNQLTVATCGSLVLLSVATSCKKAEAPPPAAPPGVEVVSVVQKDVPIYREWVGTLEGDVNAKISAQVSGYLLTRNYQEGSVVTNGQVLFQIDPAPFQAELSKAKAAQEKWALTAGRYKELRKTEAISQQELDDAVQNELAAHAQVEQAALNLAFATIRSPVNGVAGLASAAAQIGNLVGPSSGALTTVSTVDPMRAYFSVSERLLTQIQEAMLAQGKKLNSGEGPPLELLLATGSVYPLKGQVRFKNNQVDVKTGTITMVGEFANPQGLLVPGMFVQVRALLRTEKNSLLVPQRAVTDLQGRYLIAVVGADNKVSIHPVNVGEQVGTDWVITGDVKAGDRVVAEGVQKVRQDAIVNPVPFTGKPAGESPVAKADDKK